MRMKPMKGFILTADALFALSIAVGAAALLMALTQGSAIPKASYYTSSIGSDANALGLSSSQFSALGLTGSISSVPQGGRFEMRVVSFTYPSCYTTSCMTGQDIMTATGDFKQTARNQTWVKIG